MAAHITQNVHGVKRISVKRRNLNGPASEPSNTVEVVYHLADGGIVNFAAFTGHEDVTFEGEVDNDGSIAQQAHQFTLTLESYLRAGEFPGAAATEAQVAEAMYALRALIAQATGAAS